MGNSFKSSKKLTDLNSGSNTPPSGLHQAQRKEPPPRSFRLGSSDPLLKEIARDVNEISNKKITETSIVRGLIHHAKHNMSAEEVLQMVRDSL